MSKKPVPNWYSIGMLSLYVDMSRGILDSSKEQLNNLQQVQGKAHVLDDETITRIIKLHTEQNEDNWIFIEQCARWRKEKPTPDQLVEIQEIENNAREAEKTNNKILELANEYKEGTINKILAKGDGELALDFLMGKIDL